VGVSQTLRRSAEGATCIRQGGHYVGHLVLLLFVLRCVGVCAIVKVYPASPNAGSGMNMTIHCVADSEDSRKWGVAWEFVRTDSRLPTVICYDSDAALSQWHGKYECKSEGNKHSLFISKLSFNDSGNYVCIEDGGRGPDEDSFELLISRKYSPGSSFVTRKTRMTYRVGQKTGPP